MKNYHETRDTRATEPPTGGQSAGVDYYRVVGLGKSTVLRALEDVGYFCVDNLPLDLLPPFLNMQNGASREGRRIALGMDVRTQGFLLLVRGLYPGGGGDYYTHYFPYYLEVVQSHTLAPNEVWYDYFYSKGDGLFFLGMLLTDPEAPALATFCVVLCASLAMAALVARMFPKSLWIVGGSVLYLIFYIVSVSWGLGGEFQKEHEFVSALVVLTAWSICMARIERQRAFLIAAVSSAVAAAIMTQAMGILLALFFAVLAGWALLRAKWTDMWAYGIGGAVVGSTVAAIFVLNYIQTGLAGDQPLDLMLRFADFSRLDKWGVIPEIVLIRWIEDNYGTVAPPWGWDTLLQLVRFLRLDVL